ncbi:crooked neck-like protein [Arabidopsis thaliana]|uniref:Crooked neck-like protein n=1 Tax=Arabidopsis thaliana TaxID=3702 RepID=Q9SD35_ARATH|nr:crooked neck-like protein [Arabidopsis thaliana]
MVKNKTPAPVQITAEQVLKEAREREDSRILRPPKQKITDSDELAEYRLRRRKEFEDQIRGAKTNSQVWVRYADWEESQKDHDRARSVWERALEDESYRNHTLWLKYAEFEMRNKSVNHARNVWDRAVKILPRVDQFWYKYIHMEEILGNIDGARKIFERWMDWSPDQQAWLCFIKFELRYNEIERSRSIYERFVLCHPKASSFIRYAKFEMKNSQVSLARIVYERAIEMLKDVEEEAEMIFVAFAEFEELCKEVERARFLYKYALDHIPKGRAEDLYKKFVAFEKQYGNKEGIDDAIVGRRKLQYEGEVRKNPLNYDSWFDYISLEETLGDKDRIREVYERAIANVPLAEEKRYWQRYIYLWIDYALFEEILAEDVERTRAVQLNLSGARRILGNAIGKAPKHKIFKKYIEIELHLGNIDRCRKLYARYLEWSPESCYAWTKFAEFERSLAETERARAIFELAISQPRLLDRTKHYKVWLSFAKFEASAAQGQEDTIEHARAVFDRANTYYKESKPELKEERANLLEDWLNMEASFGDVSAVQSKLPKKLKKRMPITREDGETEYEEYIDYFFPEESQTMNLKILEAAHKWKKQKVDAF